MLKKCTLFQFAALEHSGVCFPGVDAHAATSAQRQTVQCSEELQKTQELATVSILNVLSSQKYN